MKQTFLAIPPWLFDGWLTVGWLIVGLLIFLWQVRDSDWVRAAKDFLPLYLIVAAVIHFVFPLLEITGFNPADPAGPPINMGLAIRGYGVFLMLAILSAVGLVVAGCRREKLDSEKALSFCFWIVVAGIAGARVFYVIQKWGSFEGPGGSPSIIDLVDMTKGGLVVYGSLVGAGVAALFYIPFSRLPVWRTFDALAPAMMLGLAIGRIGCLMNGCCYGGECGDHPFGMQFPAGSAPYMDQLIDGTLFGADSDEAKDEKGIRVGTKIDLGSVAENVGLRAGDRFLVMPPEAGRIAAAAMHQVNPSGLEVVIDSDGTGQKTIAMEVFSDRSLPIHPTQIYAAINAAMLSLILWLLAERRRFVGEVFATMIIVYPVSRFLEEVIRHDEAGIFGTPFTISQWFSMFLLVAGIALYLYLYRKYLFESPTRPTKSSFA